MIKWIEEYYSLSKKLLTTGSTPEGIMVLLFGITIPIMLTIALANHIYIFYMRLANISNPSVKEDYIHPDGKGGI